MSGIKKSSSSRGVRPSVVRRTIVGSLVVMLSPFLTVWESDADASIVHRTPIIYDSAPPVQLLVNDQIPLLSALPTDTESVLDMIKIDLRKAADETWSY